MKGLEGKAERRIGKGRGGKGREGMGEERKEGEENEGKGSIQNEHVYVTYVG